MRTFETKYGTASLRFAMIEIGENSLEEGFELSIDGEYLGDVFEIDSDDITVEEVEELLAYYL
jgi:hypothetical protein